MKSWKKITTFLKENKMKVEKRTQFHANVEYNFQSKQVSIKKINEKYLKILVD